MKNHSIKHDQIKQIVLHPGPTIIEHAALKLQFRCGISMDHAVALLLANHAVREAYND